MSATSLDLSQIKTDALSAASTFRTLIGLGSLATQSGTFSGTSSGTNTGDQDLSSLLVKASNLSDVTNAATARTNLGLGTGDTPTFSGLTLGTSGVFVGGTNLIEQRNSTNAQRFNLYGTYTDASNYRRLYLNSTTAGAFTLGVEGAGTGASGNTLAITGATYNGWVFDTALGRQRIIHSGAIGFDLQANEASNPLMRVTYAGTEFPLSITRFGITSVLASLTGSSATSALDIAQTWNTTGTPTLIKANVTDTASSSSSLLMDLQVGGSSRFRAEKDGTITTVGDIVAIKDLGGYTATRLFSTAAKTGASIYCDSFGQFAFSTGASGSAGVFSADNSGLMLSNSRTLAWSSGNILGSVDVVLARDAAQTLAQRNSTNAQVFRLYNTFTDSSNYERGKLEWASNVLRIGTEKAGTGSARALELQTDGTTRVTIASTGAVSMANLSISDSIYLGPSTSQRIRFADYVMLNSGGNWGLLDLSPQTNNQPGTLRIYNNLWSLTNYERLEVLQQHNGNAVLRTAAGGTGTRRNLELDAPALVVTDASNIAVGTTTGTKIGTATNQKLGFFNSAPVVQPTAVADATDAASVITQLNALLTRMRNLGLIAT